MISANQYPVTTCGDDRHRLHRQEGPSNPRDAKVDIGWDIVFKRNYASSRSCGVHMLDASDDVFAAALGYLHLNPNTKELPSLRRRPTC